MLFLNGSCKNAQPTIFQGGRPQLQQGFDSPLNKLARNTHCVNAKTKEDNKLSKIRPLLENLRENFLQMSPGDFNSVDEIIFPFKGRSYLHQYLPNKPHKWAFKIWRRSGVSGFLYDFDVYQTVVIKVVLLFV